MSFERQSRKALKNTIEWDVQYRKRGAGLIRERISADSVEEVFTKSRFTQSEDFDFRARKVRVVEYDHLVKERSPEGDWISYSPPTSGT
jgi:hypothetical protein